MRHILRNSLFALALSAAPAWCSLALDTDPSTGVINVPQGATNGWGFTLTSSDSSYYVLSGVEFCIGAAPPGTGSCNSTLVGYFTDFASVVNGLIIGPAYSASPYSEVFDGALQTGLGGFTADNGTATQTLNGTLYVYYDLYDGDPGAGGNQIAADQSISHVAQVNIVDATATPEPSSLLLVSLAAVAVLIQRQR